MHLISVIVPVYNVEKWLSRCIGSIVNQTYSNLEIILVDDGSTDNSGVICEQWTRRDGRIKVVHKMNGGLSDARNVGFSKANGGYVCFIDSDDWIEKNYIQYLYDLIIDNACDVSGCSYRKCEDICEEISTVIDFEKRVYNKEEAMNALIDNSIQQVVWNKLYKKTLIENLKFPKEKYHEDEFWSYQVFANITKYVESEYIGYNYFQRSDSIMGEKYSLKRLDAVEAKVQRQAFLNKNMESLASKGRKNLVFTCMYHGQLSMKYLNNMDKKKVFNRLKEILKSNKLQKEDYRQSSITHKIWMILSQHSIEMTCRLRNYLKIGI